MRYLILGGGPAGLTFANKLEQYGEKSYLVLEKEETAGGLCRSIDVDGSPLDIGGGHFLDTRKEEVNKFLFEFMPKAEWNVFDRDSRIDLNGVVLNHPIEANIWQMELEDQVEYLESIAVAGCNLGVKKPEVFIEWIYWKLGQRIADDYMIPYNQKVFGNDLNELGTYWLNKLPDVSFRDSLLSCLTKKAHGKQPAHAQFFYPKKYGYGELWSRMATKINHNIRYGESARGLDFNNNSVITENGNVYKADVIITTIPWMEFNELKGMPDSIKNNIRKLKYSSIQTDYYSDNLDSEAHWIYYPNDELSYHRILLRHNFLPNAKGYWTETNGERLTLNKNKSKYQYFNKYAYPLNTINKPKLMKDILEWSKEKKVYGIGRWGEHQHYNSDVTVEKAIELANELISNFIGGEL